MDTRNYGRRQHRQSKDKSEEKRHYTGVYTRMGYVQMGMARVQQERPIMDIWRNAEEKGQSRQKRRRTG